MKALVGLAVVLGLAGTVLGFVAVTDSDEHEELTLTLQGGEEIRNESTSAHATEAHDKLVSYGAEQEITGDRTGEYTRICQPIAADDFQCVGGFLLEDGSIEFSSTGEDEDTTVGVITGGTDAYDRATGTVAIDHEAEVYTLRLVLPDD